MTTFHKLTSLALVSCIVGLATSCKKDDEDPTTTPCTETTWYEDADGDGFGNANVSLFACDQPAGYVSNNSDPDDNDASTNSGITPTSAFSEFDPNSVTVTFSGSDVTLLSNALPGHTSPYWATTNSLYIAPVVADPAQMSPGTISAGSYTLTVPNAPQIAASSSATGLGAIGIAVSGVPIFNDEEGPNIALSAQVASGFDYAGGHMGPTGYHYHLESSDVSVNTTLSYDDEDLVGILQDGFLLYGRKCNSTGDHPLDLDVSGGHLSATQHSSGDTFYHYHIINEFYIGTYILLFGGDLQGTPNVIN